MMQTPTATLLRPFETGDLAAPPRGARVLFLGAEPGLSQLRGWGVDLTCVNGFRPSFLALEREGCIVRPQADGDGFDMALVLAGKHRGLNEARIGEAWERVRDGATILVAGAKGDGIDSLRKRTAGRIPLAGALSKHHGVAFWFGKATGDEPPYTPDAGAQRVDDRFVTGPGMFSSDAVDPASLMLADHLPATLAGDVADFCAGWGYLAARVADLPKVRSVDLYEADHASLEAARTNLSAMPVPFSFHWHDLTSEPVAKRYDAIVMNPPFHAGRAAEPDIGRRMIAAAAGALRKGGMLHLVANRRLPYEQEMSARFAAHGEKVSDTRFKVLWGRK